MQNPQIKKEYGLLSPMEIQNLNLSIYKNMTGFGSILFEINHQNQWRGNPVAVFIGKNEFESEHMGMQFLASEVYLSALNQINDIILSKEQNASLEEIKQIISKVLLSDKS